MPLSLDTPLLIDVLCLLHWSDLCLLIRKLVLWCVGKLSVDHKYGFYDLLVWYNFSARVPDVSNYLVSLIYSIYPKKNILQLHHTSIGILVVSSSHKKHQFIVVSILPITELFGDLFQIFVDIFSYSNKSLPKGY